MVTYILGNSIRKRARFSCVSGEEELYIDDMKIACDVMREGVYCYATEGRPFKNMRVVDFVAYARCMFDKEAKNSKYIKNLLKSVGYHGLISKKIGRVNVSDYLRILLASRIKDTTRTLYVNLDTWQYSAKNLRKMKNLFSSLLNFSVCALVSDIRFCEYGDEVLYLTKDRDLVVMDGECKRKRMSRKKVMSYQNVENSCEENGA